MQLAHSQSQPPPPPTHVAIIMDGNGRWARARGLTRTAGHKRGAEATRAVAAGARELGIAYLTLYGFSSENWKRPAAEVDDLMGLLRLYLRAEIAELHKNGIRLRVIGDRERLGSDIVSLIENAEAQTRDNAALDLTRQLSGDGRHPGSGPGHPDRRGEAFEQFPAVAIGLRRAGFHGQALAGLHQTGSRGCDP
jgi:undecaprenyl diphosphate synthase